MRIECRYINERDNMLDSREKLQRRIGELEDENKALVQHAVDLKGKYDDLEKVHATLLGRISALRFDSGEA